MIRRIFSKDWFLGFTAFAVAYFAGLVNADTDNIVVRLVVLFVAIMVFQYVIDALTKERGGKKP